MMSSSQTGVVAFLDVLGWKGVYDRKDNAVGALRSLIQEEDVRAEKFRGKFSQEIVIKSISDTVVVLLACSQNEISSGIMAVGEICEHFISRSIVSELPMRGAVSYGEFFQEGNIFVGKAVDEAAAWHEYADWIGVHLTPSAEFVFVPQEEQTLWQPYAPPLKNKLNWEAHCVNWTRSWEDRDEALEGIKRSFCQLGPIVPEIAGKFTNTLKFIEAMDGEGVDPIK